MGFSSSPELVRLLEGLFYQQIELTRQGIRLPLAGRAGNLKPVIFSLTDTGRALGILARSGAWNELVMLSRAFLERAINVCYLLVCDDTEYECYFRHTKQKAYRLLNRQLTSAVGSVTVSVENAPAPSSIPGLEEALESFTSSKGKEINRWTKTNLVDRIEVICSRSPVNAFVFLCALCAIYQDASEALHATLYGCTFHVGIWSPGKQGHGLDAIDEWNLGTVSFLFLVFGYLLEAVISMLGEYGELGATVEDSARASRRATRAYRDAAKVAETPRDA